MTTSDLGGIDSLLSTVQMPGGIPVATTAIGKSGAVDAAWLAIAILALSGPILDAKLNDYRDEMAETVQKDDADLQGVRHG